MAFSSVVKNLGMAAAGAALLALGTAGAAQASTFTKTSPTSGGLIGSGFSEVGGIVLDLIGANGARVTSQLAASGLYQGFFSSNSNKGIIGTQTGFNSSLFAALGGGLSEVGVRFTLYDGDTASGNFDFQDNTLLLNGLNFGNWSNVKTQATNSNGQEVSPGMSSGGFRDEVVDTGWFYANNSGLLGSFYNSLVSSGNVEYAVYDRDPGDNYYDFKQGVSSSLVNVSQGPSVQPPAAVPEPGSAAALLALGALGTGSLLKRKQPQQA